MSKLIKAVIYYTTIIITIPLWLPIMLGLMLIFSMINWELDPANMDYYDYADDEGDTNNEM